jgi:hypothetical protein
MRVVPGKEHRVVFRSVADALGRQEDTRSDEDRQQNACDYGAHEDLASRLGWRGGLAAALR